VEAVDPKTFQTFTLGQFCKTFQVQPDECLRLIADGTVPAYKLGPHVRIPVDGAIRSLRPVGKKKVGDK
jgi:hypothetical protein